MTFIEAIDALQRGFKVQRQSWKAADRRTIPLMVGSERPHLITNADGYPWCPSIHDLTADDWEWSVPAPGEKERVSA